MNYPKEFLKYLHNSGQAVYLVRTVYPYSDGDTILGFVLSIEEFDKYAENKFGITAATATHVEYNTYGKGSKHYCIKANPKGVLTEEYELVCEPLTFLPDTL